MSDKRTTVVVTGGAGFIGSNLALELERRYPNFHVIVIDDFSSGSYENLRGFNGEVLTTRLGDRAAERDLNSIKGPVHFIFHQAALTDTRVDDSVRMMRSNVESLRQLLSFSLTHCAKLIYASSSAVYGQHPEKIMVEGHHEEPLNIYGFSKLMADNLALRAISVDHEPGVVGLRYFNVYGPGEQHKRELASMVYQLYRQYEAQRDNCIKFERALNIELFENTATCKRDWVYVQDVVNANLLAMEAESGIYNVGTGKPASFVDLIDYIGRNLGLAGQEIKFSYKRNPREKVYQRYTHASLALSRGHLFPDHYQFADHKEGIKLYIDHLKDNNER